MFSALAAKHLGTRTDVVLGTLQHDTPGAMAYPGGTEHDWRVTGETPVPGKTMGPVAVVERDYAAVADKWAALGPLVDTLGLTTKGVTDASGRGGRRTGRQVRRDGFGSGARTPGDHDGGARWRTRSWRCRAPRTGGWPSRGSGELEKRTGRRLVHLAEGSEERRITYADTQARPVPVITSPEWSGSETGGRRYAPFTVNIEELKPFHTLTGRMHFYLDHDWLEELGEQLPIYRPPLDMSRLFGEPAVGSDRGSG